jgi:hypothetical protein
MDVTGQISQNGLATGPVMLAIRTPLGDPGVGGNLREEMRSFRFQHVAEPSPNDLRECADRHEDPIARLAPRSTVPGKTLGHGMNSKATAVYARLMLDPVREQLEQATSAMLANVSDNKETVENEVSEDNRSHEAKG